MEVSKDTNGIDIEIGTLSHGTLRNQDLFRRFHEECVRRHLLSGDQEYFGDIICDVNDGDSVWYGERISALVDEMIEKLSDGLAEDVYFGANEGDGSDFGYWRQEVE